LAHLEGMANWPTRFRCHFHPLGDTSLSGWGKAGWAILLIFVPWLGALIYLIARDRRREESARFRNHHADRVPALKAKALA
jgi:hypothetical protein